MGVKLEEHESVLIPVKMLKKAASLPPRFNFAIGGYSWEFFFKYLPNSDKLFVIFSGSKAQEEIYPVFRRHSWNFEFDGSVLFISDPIYSIYHNLALGWYLGDANLNFYPLIAIIVNALKASLNCSSIYAYGSSGGGFAALKLAEYLPMTAVAINPQIYLRRYHYFEEFCKITGFDSAPDLTQRCELRPNNLSNCLILQNDTDWQHLDQHLYPLLQTRGLFPKYGLNKDGNLYIWIYHKKGGHNAQENKAVLSLILNIASLLPIKTEQELNAADNLCIAINELWARS